MHHRAIGQAAGAAGAPPTAARNRRLSWLKKDSGPGVVGVAHAAHAGLVHVSSPGATIFSGVGMITGLGGTDEDAGEGDGRGCTGCATGAAVGRPTGLGPPPVPGHGLVACPVAARSSRLKNAIPPVLPHGVEVGVGVGVGISTGRGDSGVDVTVEVATGVYFGEFSGGPIIDGVGLT